MKKRTRTISISIITALTLAILLVFPLSAACADEHVAATDDAVSGTDSENITDNEGNADSKSIGEAEGETADADGEENGADPDTDSGEGASDVQGNNVFSELFEMIYEHSAQLLSALAFIGSVIIMICYKMGFLPMVKDGVRALAAGVDTLGKHTGSISDGTEKLRSDFEKKLRATEDVLNKMADTLSLLEVKLSAEGATRDELSTLKVVMAGEVDMLYEIFMAAALPQYLKDSVGERIAAMRKSLGSEDKQ